MARDLGRPRELWYEVFRQLGAGFPEFRAVESDLGRLHGYVMLNGFPSMGFRRGLHVELYM
jgi:hypothetical protein